MSFSRHKEIYQSDEPKGGRAEGSASLGDDPLAWPLENTFSPSIDPGKVPPDLRPGRIYSC
jgi:hypothetical protein